MGTYVVAARRVPAGGGGAAPVPLRGGGVRVAAGGEVMAAPGPARVTRVHGAGPAARYDVAFLDGSGAAPALPREQLHVVSASTAAAAAWWPPIAPETRVVGRADGGGVCRTGTVLGGSSVEGYLVAWDAGEVSEGVARLDLLVLTGAAAEAATADGCSLAVVGDVVRVACTDGSDAWAVARVDAVRCAAAFGGEVAEPYTLPGATVEVTFLDFSLDIDVDSARRVVRDRGLPLAGADFEMLAIASLESGGTLPPVFVAVARDGDGGAAGGAGAGGAAAGGAVAAAASAPPAAAGPTGASSPAPAASDDMDVDMDVDG